MATRVEREERIQRGACANCGGPREDRGMIHCGKCRASARRWLKTRTPELIRGYRLTMVAKRLRAGLCPRCGHEKADKAFYNCLKCREMARDWFRANAQTLKVKRALRNIEAEKKGVV